MKYIVFALTLILIISALACTKTEIKTFEDCVKAGNPVMESYPRQCASGDRTFTEDLKHVCTSEEKNAEGCTYEYMPVCGDDGITYGNRCSACASKKIDSYVPGECKGTKNYLSKSTEQCTRMGIWQCDEGMIVFSDETGCGCKSTRGYLSGKVTIGPLCPVEKIPPDPNCQATVETYNSWPIAIFNSDGINVKTITGDATGSFNLELAPGEYTIDLENKPGVGGSNLPKRVKISLGETQEISIDIDTGIR